MIAILCSGQGNQHRQMFERVGSVEAAEPVFAAAARHLDGRDPRDLVADAGADIHANRTAQILCVTAAIATWTALSPDLGDLVRVVAGYSVGEVAAWFVSGAMDAETTLAITAERARLMDEASSGKAGMVAVVGLARPAIDALCRDAGVDVAIRNGPDHVVLAGDAGAIDAAAALAQKRGARRVAPVAVAVPSHTGALDEAARRFRQHLNTVRDIRDPGPRLLSGIDGETVFDTRTGLAKLARQVSRTVDWAACMAACRAAGAGAALELGPGHALATMMEGEIGEGLCRSVEEFRTLEAAARWSRARAER